jgi:flavin reductase (DIM6/NTAB) family NADH-FMN oxidoreductase RutF
MSIPATVPAPSHLPVEPKIIYPGTPVVLVASLNPDGSANLAPMSSFWALGRAAVLGLGGNGRTCANLERTGECVLNFPDESLWRAVERLAPLTGQETPPPHVLAYGGRFERDKFAAAGLTPMPSVRVTPPRVQECPLQLECRVAELRPLSGSDRCVAVQVQVVQVHAAPAMVGPDRRRIDPSAWHPLIYNFRCYHGLGPLLGRSFREGR